MSRLVKNIANNIFVEFDKGSFDDWCVYLTRIPLPRYAPKDTEYFLFLSQMATLYGAEKIYNDFIRIYDQTHAEVDNATLQLITDITTTYPKHTLEMDVWLTVIYAGMVAEENKAHAVLKKRIKRLGVYQVLMEQRTPQFAASFSRGKKWKELDAIMRERGF